MEAGKAPEDPSSLQSSEDEFVTIIVRDTGKGISEEFLRGRIYTPFVQEDSLAIGTGLGLSIVRSLVKSMGGRISIDSRLGEGTTVKVLLPLARPNPSQRNGSSLPSNGNEAPLASSIPKLRETHAGRKVAILGVEPAEAPEHPTWGVLFRYLTNWYGLELVSTSSSEPIDVVLADEMALAKHSSSTDAYPALLILGSSQIGHNVIKSHSYSFAKMAKIISRPCGPNKLARYMQKLLKPQFSSPSVTKPDRSPQRLQSEGSFTDSGSADRNSLSNDTTTSSDTQGTSPSTPPRSSVSGTSGMVEPPSEISQARVLVVEDNAINLNLILAFLRKMSLETLDKAENGKMAVDAVRNAKKSYDIIFMGMLISHFLRHVLVRISC
jgi:hypothetical protein